ncbi:16S rRNA (guanine966-N2)-methyltransferase [Nakamurella panacisegetis]|uniref:16S rRNA (Guanine966-N2)-methyltransferase n=1 Tax=Nakamurella panacisegetis TaxID=1090615 RepID=A0A1H0T346_9ACTN|nr:16S rRNA (guanine(966)-N(2))-methyltransferase RsmD [Nakamurella panacisegetis]SDP48245.1 16S rRNA (guanine966-N2)-methyltransferase [Nakamurella panacisegetis]
MTRITAGTYRGRRLQTPPGETTRPTSERVREALANALVAAGGLNGARVLDLYAGSGALGLELLSRGADSLVAVERERSALVALRANVAALGAADAQVVAADVGAFARTPAGRGFDFVVADPPYDLPTVELGEIFAALQAGGHLNPGADLIVERSKRSGEMVWPEPLVEARTKKYGDTRLCFGRAPANRNGES